VSRISPVAFAIPGDLDTPTGGYAYDRRVIASLRSEGREVSYLRLGDSFPHPTAADQSDATEQLSSLPASMPVIVDGLALGALEPAALEQVSAPIIALVHHPLAFEGDLDERRRDELLSSERVNLARSSAVIVTSPATARLLVDQYGVDPDDITIAVPGTDQPATPHHPSYPPLILSVGSHTHRKGHDVLLDALAQIVDLSWEALIVGSARDREYSERLEAIRQAEGLSHRVTMSGALGADELEALYARATVFALATRFEGYGMVFAEAMAHGLPIVSCDTGAVAETIAPGAGLLTAPDDPEAFAEALRSVLTDAHLRSSLASASRTAGEALPSWQDTAGIIAAVIDQLEGHGDD